MCKNNGKTNEYDDFVDSITEISRKIDFSKVEETISHRNKNNNKNNKNWWLIMLLNKNNGGHTMLKKTTNPYKIIDTLPLQDGDKIWVCGYVIDIGNNKKHADIISNHISGSFSESGKQVRGVISRTVIADLVCDKYNLKIYGDFDNILDVSNSSDKIEKHPFEKKTFNS